MDSKQRKVDNDGLMSWDEESPCARQEDAWLDLDAAYDLYINQVRIATRGEPPVSKEHFTAFFDRYNGNAAGLWLMQFSEDTAEMFPRLQRALKIFVQTYETSEQREFRRMLYQIIERATGDGSAGNSRR